MILLVIETGMNEIIGPLYFTFSTDKDETYRQNAEADTFFCFTNLMSEIRDRFIKVFYFPAVDAFLSRITVVS